MNVRRKSRVHPMTALVVWLGVSLVACVLALAHVVGKLPSDALLDSYHLEGMKAGYSMCMGYQEEQEAQETKPAQPVLLGVQL